MKRRTITVYALLFVLIASTVGLGFVSSVKANFIWVPPDIVINSPANGTICYSSDVSVDLVVNDRAPSYPFGVTFAICRLDGENPINVTFVLFDGNNAYWTGNGIFNNVSGGIHYLTVEVHLRDYSGGNFKNTYNASSTFYVDLPTPTNPPAINLSLAYRTYDKPVVPLVFNVNDSTSWLGYSLDNQLNETISGNVTLTDLTEGNHSLVVYANDTFGNMGKSDTAYFAVSLPAPTPSPTPTPSAMTATSPSVPEFPTWTVIAALVITVLAASTYRKKRKTQDS